MAAATRAEAQWQSFRMCVMRGVRSSFLMIKKPKRSVLWIAVAIYRRLEKGKSILCGTQTTELSKKIRRLHPQCRMKNRGTPVLPLTHRKWRRAKNKTRTSAHTEAVTTASSCTTSPKQSPRLMYFIGALPPSELAKASCITPTNVLHKYVWRLPSSVDLLTPRFSVCARP